MFKVAHKSMLPTIPRTALPGSFRVWRRHNHTGARVIFSGIQPTGTPHVSLDAIHSHVRRLSQYRKLGNYLGALSNWTNLQSTAAKNDTLIFSVVGLHAITLPQDPAQLRRDRLDAMASLLAIGIDPSRCILFQQEDVRLFLNYVCSSLTLAGPRTCRIILDSRLQCTPRPFESYDRVQGA